MSLFDFKVEELVVNWNSMKQFNFYSLEFNFKNVYLKEIINIQVQGRNVYFNFPAPDISVSSFEVNAAKVLPSSIIFKSNIVSKIDPQ
jgi:hypothetical protein